MVDHLQRVTRWLGVTVFELCVVATTLFISLLLVLFKLFHLLDCSWFVTLLPLFISDAICTYFCIIVCFRLCLNGSTRKAIYRTGASFNQIALLFLFKMMIYLKFDNKVVAFSELFAPLVAFMVFLSIRICFPN